MADEIDVCLIFCSVFGGESAENYCMSLGLPDSMIRRMLVDGRYRAWTVGPDGEPTDPRRSG
jgi:hypothetical protein